MYNENSFKKQLFWLKVKRIFLIIVFCIIGSALGVVISSYLIEILFFPEQTRNIVIIALVLAFLAISLLLTSNTGKKVQEGYWKIAVLRKLTLISKKLDNLDYLENLESLETLESMNDLLISLNSRIEKDNNLFNTKLNNIEKIIKENFSDDDE